MRAQGLAMARSPTSATMGMAADGASRRNHFSKGAAPNFTRGCRAVSTVERDFLSPLATAGHGRDDARPRGSRLRRVEFLDQPVLESARLGSAHRGGGTDEPPGLAAVDDLRERLEQT